ncbi:acyl-CoA dehydrogenase family protein [Mycobacterium sp. OTB74]|uniref:acyl-CoA dehydrogenase family protein n=1 Tax=Mycobacterium sp. OTB74 TaxID=1853452 RepID=UPI00247520AF|nr:acyl-CoA dehydrogenase family protein [Mycobacterium sp. OTB74]MDH6245210.1 alkylation response protein AidB-like acyl-CoA dehydrogenase [Mycobacterium sp. OTB74]
MTELQEFHDELRTVARELLATQPDWQQIVDAGWTGLEVPEDQGGAGASFAETAILLEEMGRAAAHQPFLGTVLAVGAVTDPVVLQRIAQGATAAVATGFTAADGKVSGRAEFVPDAAAEILLLATDDAVVTAQVTVTQQPVLDESRSLGVVEADDATITQSWPLAGSLQQRAEVAIACDSLGIAEAMLAKTVDYAKIRNQFGRAIGSFQAVKHACADMQVKISVARQLVSAAVDAIAAGRDAEAPAHMAKSYATEMAVEVVGKAMQLHGGIGYTWESDVHRYLKRAALNRSLYGSPAAHRQQLAQRFG